VVQSDHLNPAPKARNDLAGPDMWKERAPRLKMSAGPLVPTKGFVSTAVRTYSLTSVSSLRPDGSGRFGRFRPVADRESLLTGLLTVGCYWRCFEALYRRWRVRPAQVEEQNRRLGSSTMKYRPHAEQSRTGVRLASNSASA
jgi:hypothetical protein